MGFPFSVVVLRSGAGFGDYLASTKLEPCVVQSLF